MNQTEANRHCWSPCTVFQAEVTAIRISAEKLLNKGLENQTITFFSDSQASLAALNKLTVKSDTVDKCINTLNELGKTNRIHLRDHAAIDLNICCTLFLGVFFRF